MAKDQQQEPTDEVEELIEASADRLDHPETWRTGGDPVTPPQKATLVGMAQGAGEDPREVISEVSTKAEASEKIQELRDKQGADLDLSDAPPASV